MMKNIACNARALNGFGFNILSFITYFSLSPMQAKEIRA